MRLSAEQARLAHDYLQQKGPRPVESALLQDVPPELITRALETIAGTPDPCPSRVEHAIGALRGNMPTSHEVAERIVWRMLADSLR